jgi:hypothetical protein
MDQLIEAMRAQITDLDHCIQRNRDANRDYVADLYVNEQAGVQWCLDAALDLAERRVALDSAAVAS